MQKDPDATPEPDDRKPGVPPHQPQPDDARDEEQRVEENTEESFPSSDPPATGGPGI